ncbi:hypothetical protein ACFV1L_21905 [Kitasatospora sp. NPDC059646]|uniref:hypothetical protein n=1 Tax=Kitasatospora sp. NPDC059646 TaxID=3346893 RepID=UPI0036B1F148
MSSQRPPLIGDHWHHVGPVRPDGTDGYWICARPDCGRHRSDHIQVEGEWLRRPPHRFRPQWIAPARCRTCGYHWRHTFHMPWRWDQWEAPTPPPE